MLGAPETSKPWYIHDGGASPATTVEANDVLRRAQKISPNQRGFLFINNDGATATGIDVVGRARASRPTHFPFRRAADILSRVRSPDDLALKRRETKGECSASAGTSEPRGGELLRYRHKADRALVETVHETGRKSRSGNWLKSIHIIYNDAKSTRRALDILEQPF